MLSSQQPHQQGLYTDVDSQSSQTQLQSKVRKPNSIINDNDIIHTNNNINTSFTNNKVDVNIVLVDHYDSYTYNIYDMIADMCVHPPLVVINDPGRFPTFGALEEYVWNQTGRPLDGLISSPGPGRPPNDVSPAVLDAMRTCGYRTTTTSDSTDSTVPAASAATPTTSSSLPILGVCLGHQALGHVHGHAIQLAPCGPVHGQISTVSLIGKNNHHVIPIPNQTNDCDNDTTGNGNDNDNDTNGNQAKEVQMTVDQQHSLTFPSLWKGIPSQFQAVRYHSLVVGDVIEELSCTDIDSNAVGPVVPAVPVAMEKFGKMEGTPTKTKASSPPATNTNLGLPLSSPSLSSNLTTPWMDASFSSISSLLQPTAICYDEPTTCSHTINNDKYNDNDNSNAKVPIVMAMQHKELPHYGIQFHPESIGTQYGYQMFRNFVHVCNDYQRQQQSQTNPTKSIPTKTVSTEKIPQPQTVVDEDCHTCTTMPLPPQMPNSPPNVLIYKLKMNSCNENSNNTAVVTPEQVFDNMYSSCSHSFWLDSSNSESIQAQKGKGGTNYTNFHQSRFSILGGYGSRSCGDSDGGGDTKGSNINSNTMGSLYRRLEYYGMDHPRERRGLHIYSPAAPQEEMDHTITDQQVIEIRETKQDMNILQYMQQSLSGPPVDSVIHVALSKDGDNNGGTHRLQRMADSDKDQPLPFEYRGGYIGYLGYEMRHDSLQSNHGVKRHVANEHADPNVPTAAFLFADRSLVYDHWKKDWYLIGVTAAEEQVSSVGENNCNSDGVENVLEWMTHIQARMESLQELQIAEMDVPSIDNNNNYSRKNVTNSSSNNGVVYTKQSSVAFVPNRAKHQYQRDIDTCHKLIRMGESYELCLTNQLEATVRVPVRPIASNGNPSTSATLLGKNNKSSPPLDLYKILRRRNPAPFSAFLNFNANRNQPTTCTESVNAGASIAASMAICCSSPERFISVKQQVTEQRQQQGNVALLKTNSAESKSRNSKQRNISFQVESKPIKGTCARSIPSAMTTTLPTLFELEEDSRLAHELQSGVKNRAENLMIVDLLRNDLSRVCQAGSVHVPKLMHIESYATVHQMVSTIRGTLSAGKNSLDVLFASFPGGSMTGAPKLRSTELLDGLELGASRGPYSGCLGYISLNGSMDMNIVIRSAVLTPAVDTNSMGDNGDCGWLENGQKTEQPPEEWKVSIGAGGAITALSESDDEYQEMLLKARAVVESVQTWCHPGQEN